MIDQTSSSLARALLKEGRAYRAPDGLRKRTLTALGVAASTGIVSGALAWISARSWTTKVVLALSTATLISAIPMGYMALTHNAPAAPVMAPVTVDEPGPEMLPSPPEPEPAPAPARAPQAPALRTTAPTRPAPPTASALRAETAALDAVRSSLGNDDPAGALSFLAAYFRTFPRGRLHPEAEVLRIDALAKSGHMESARRHARQFLKQHPNSVLAPRVRTYAEP